MNNFKYLSKQKINNAIEDGNILYLVERGYSLSEITTKLGFTSKYACKRRIDKLGVSTQPSRSGRKGRNGGHNNIREAMYKDFAKGLVQTHICEKYNISTRTCRRYYDDWIDEGRPFSQHFLPFPGL